MTILKSLKSCINLNLTSSGERLNLHSLCNSHCNLDSILQQLVLFVKYIFFFSLPFFKFVSLPQPRLGSSICGWKLYRECCNYICEWMNKVESWKLNCQIIVVNVILMPCSYYIADIISCQHKSYVRYSMNTYPIFLFSEQPPERELVISGQALEQFRNFS